MTTATRGRGAFVPLDRSKKEHIGRVAEHKWQAEDGSKVILRLIDGSSVIGPGSYEMFLKNQQYRFYGKWIDGKFGPDFHFDTYTIDAPHFELGVVKYLSDNCRGIGTKTAAKLWAEFGPDAVRILREEPGKVIDAGILDEHAAATAAEDLQQYAHIEKTRIDLFGIFAGRGFHGKLIDAAIGKYGVSSPDLIRRSPYRLMIDKLPSCGFRRVDKLYLDNGGKPTALKRQALAGWNAFREDRTGSTWLDAAECVSMIEKLIPGSAEPIKAIKLLIRAGWLRIRRDGAKRYLAVREKADAEARVAGHVKRLRQASPLWPTDLPVSQVEGDGLPSQHQIDQLRQATTATVCALTGGPGTGKTHTLAYLLRSIIRDYGRDAICGCAPTGKASVRACEALRNLGLDIRVTTIHQLLEIGRNGHDGAGWGFTRNERNPLEQRFVIVDETSMVDTTLMADLLGACGDGAHVMFVGDTFQLPPVGHGAPLRDLLAGGMPFGQLTEVRRNAGSIVRACQAIKASTPVSYSRKLELDAPDPANLVHIDCTQQQVPATLEDVISAVTRFDKKWETQVIVGLNDKSDSSRKKINERLGGLLNPDGRAAKGNPFKVGDKVICRRNQRLKTYAPSSPNLPPSMATDGNCYFPTPFDSDGIRVIEWYVANGEIGRIVAVSERGSVVRFGGPEVPLCWFATKKGRPAEADDGETEAKSDDFEHAWAITCHSGQGSEYPLVICLIDDAASSIADRNFWYTAISRARRACVVIGPKGVIDKQVKKQSIDRRRTFLAELLKEQIETQEPESQPQQEAN